MRLAAAWAILVVVVLTFNVAEAQPPSHSGETYDPPIPNMQVFGPYGELLNKTVLQSSLIPSLPETMMTNLPAERSQAIAKIESELAARGIAVVQDGPHFVRIFPKYLSGFLTNAPLRGAELAALSTKTQETTGKQEKISGSGQELLPEGMVDFRDADVRQVLDIFAMLVRRSVLTSGFLAAPPIRLKSKNPTSLEEGIYAVATTLALNGILVINDGDKFVQVVPMAEVKNVKLNSPKASEGAMLLDPEKDPAAQKPNAGASTDAQFQRLQSSYYDILDASHVRQQQAGQLLKFYAAVTDKTAIPSKNLDEVVMTFRITSPVSREELLYAVERTLALNQLSIVSVDAKTIQLGSIGAGPVASRRTYAPPRPGMPPNRTPGTNQMFPLPRLIIRTNTSQP